MTIRLILTNEVTGLGGPGDVVEVKDGYGRNYLLPRRLALKASKGAEKEIASIRRARDARDIRDLGSAQQVAEQLRSLSVSLANRASGEGRLFGSVTAGDIAEAVKSAGGPLLDKRRVQIPTAIKSVGAHTVTVRLHPEVEASITVEVVAS